MHTGQRRFPAINAQGPGHRAKIIGALVFAAIAAGWFVFEPTDIAPPSRVETPAASSCNPETTQSTAPACDPTTANHSDAATLSASTTETGPTPENVPPKTAARPWHDDSPDNSFRPRAGYTLAELCAADLESDEYFCEAGSYQGRFVADDTSGAADITTGLSISGQVLTREGRGLAGVKLVATLDRTAGATPDSDIGSLRFCYPCQ
jgi:hypothetical protein